jgi:hypothetical protein
MALAEAGTDTRLMAGGAALLGAAVLADSAAEHYRGSFRNPAMVLPIVSSAVAIAVNSERALDPASPPPVKVGWATHGASIAIGLTGLGFHLYNVGKQVGGYCLNNLFYKAPLGAPGALVITGLIGGMAQARAQGVRALGPVPLRSGRAMGALTAAGLIGTVAEAAFLHFRGAYHDPFMWAPVTLPPIAAASIAADTITGRPSRASFALLGATAVLGFVGVCFHSWGIARNMGGWRNFRQNYFVGPPVPAPPSYTGIAIAGIGALLQMKRRRRG